jgi:hypothetical protein
VDAVDVDATTGSVGEPRHEKKSEARVERKGYKSSTTK